MAGEIPNLRVVVEIDTSGVTAGVSKVKEGLATVSSEAEKTGTKMRELKDLMLGVFGGNLITQGVMGLEKTLSEMNLAVQDAQVEQGRLETAMTNAGVATEANKAKVEASVKSYAALGFTHAQAAQAMGTLVTATGSVTESTKLMTMAADLARYKHEDLNTAATTLARGTQGSVKAFKELGITLDTTLPKNQAIAKAFDELNGKIGGQAVAYTHTFAGEIAVLKEKFNEIAVAIGNVVFPIVTKLIKLFMDVAKVVGDFYNVALKPLVDFVRSNIGVFEAFFGVLAAGFVAFKTYEAVTKAVQLAQEAYYAVTLLLKGVQIEEIAVTEGLTGAMATLNAVMEANPIGLVVLAVAALAAGFVLLWNNSETFRKAVTAGIEVIIEAFGYLVGAIGKVIEAATHLPFIGSHFKGIADAVNGAAVEIGNFGKNLDSLANKKISLPDFLGGSTSLGGSTAGGATGVTGAIPGGDTTKAAVAAAKKAADAAAAESKKQVAELVADQKQVKSIYDQMNVDLRDYSVAYEKLQQTHNDAIAKANLAFNLSIADSQQRLNEANLAATTANNDAIAKLQQAAADKQLAIVQQSEALLTNEFANVTKIDLGKSFFSSGTTTGLIGSLKDQLAAMQTLAADASKLAGLGYSQNFIQQVVAQGPLMGDQMAQTLIKAQPGTTAQIQSLFSQVQDASSTGLDGLAAQMNQGGQLATQALVDQYNKVAADLNTSLAAQADSFNDVLAKNKQSYDDAVAKAQTTLQDALAASQQTFDQAATALHDSTMTKLSDLQTKLEAVATAMAKVNSSGVGLGAMALAGSVATPYISGSSSLPTTSASVTPAVVYNQTNNISTPVSASDIASATYGALTYGVAQGIAAKINAGKAY
jgi:phage-related protein